MTTSSTFEEALIAIERGDYRECLSCLELLSTKHPLNTQEGAKIRMLMITAWMGQGEDQKAIDSCRLLTKINCLEIRQEAKQLISILEAPNLARPKDWSIQIPNIDLQSSGWSNQLIINKAQDKKTSLHPPTGPTKAFGIGFSIFIISVLIILTVILSQ
tara:strand:+ start:25795 stop:26271 length:477 start_codon:yes stop_codon:yes gene_type:complete